MKAEMSVAPAVDVQRLHTKKESTAKPLPNALTVDALGKRCNFNLLIRAVRYKFNEERRIL